MKLKDYFTINNIRPTHFLKDLDISQQHLWGIMRGANRPSFKLAKKIQILTNGSVTVDDLMPAKISKNIIDLDIINEEELKRMVTEHRRFKHLNFSVD